MGYSGRRLAGEICVSIVRDRLMGPKPPVSAIEHLVCVALLHQAFQPQRCANCRFHDVCDGYVSATSGPAIADRSQERPVAAATRTKASQRRARAAAESLE